MKPCLENRNIWLPLCTIKRTRHRDVFLIYVNLTNLGICISPFTVKMAQPADQERPTVCILCIESVTIDEVFVAMYTATIVYSADAGGDIIVLYKRFFNTHAPWLRKCQGTCFLSQSQHLSGRFTGVQKRISKLQPKIYILFIVRIIHWTLCATIKTV